MNKTIAHIMVFSLTMLFNPYLHGIVIASNIDTNHKYSWIENAGWLNFHPSHEGVTIYPDHLEGYAWAENIGWIQLGSHNGGGTHTYENTSKTNWGVNNDSLGALSGYAWSNKVGWINFNPSHSQVTINIKTGDFNGYAWSENVGWIHFQKIGNPSYKVRHDFFSIPTVNLSISLTTGTETDMTEVTVIARASHNVTGNQTLSLTVTGTEITNSDYFLTDTTITIPDGTTEGSVTFIIQDDSKPENTETATLTLNNPSTGLVLGSTTSMNVIITDNDTESLPDVSDDTNPRSDLSDDTPPQSDDTNPLSDSSNDTNPPSDSLNDTKSYSSDGVENLRSTFTLFVSTKGGTENKIRLTSDSDTINHDHCDEKPCECTDKCQYTFKTTTWVDISYHAADSYFIGWEGDRQCAEGKLWMVSNKRCVAHFRPLAKAAGNGLGRVKTKIHDSVATLTAIAATGSLFSHWSGNCDDSHQNTIQISLKGETSCTAYFALAPRLTHLSTRLPIQSHVDNIITYFTLTGTGTQTVMIRGLASVPHMDPLVRLQEFPGGKRVAINDNWEEDSRVDEIPLFLKNEFLYPSEAGMLVDLEPGTYMATLISMGMPLGIGEINIDVVDDDSQPLQTQLINISNQAFLLDEMKSSFTINGTGMQPIMIRGLALEPGVDPLIKIQKSPGGETVASNDNWQDDPHATEIPNHLLPPNPTDAGLRLNLPAGDYTVILNSKGTNGLGQIELELAD